MKVYPLIKANYFFNSIERIVSHAQADDEIIANYFVIREDTMGLKFLSLLFQAARRGVRVKLIVDSYGSCLDAGNGTEYISEPLSKELLTTLKLNGIELFIYRPIVSSNIFHPLNLMAWKNYSRRNHNKIFAFNLKKKKERGVILGDSQWAHEHFNSQFIGHNLLILSTKLYIEARQYNMNLIQTNDCERWSTNKVHQYHVNFWEKRLSLPIKSAPFDFSFLKEFEVDNAEFVYSEVQFDCMEKRKSIQDIEIKILNKIKNKGIYCTPYFSPDRKMLKALFKFVLKGGKIYIGKYSDDPYLPYGVHKAVSSFFKKNLSIFSYNGYGNVHYKDLICDDFVFIKSANGEGRSRFYNLDSGILIKNEELSQFFYQNQLKTEKEFLQMTNIKHVKIKHSLLERSLKFLIRPLYYHHL